MTATGGDQLLRHYSKKQRYDYRHDMAMQNLGYATDNCAFYYYNIESSRDYEQTIKGAAVYAQQQSICIPYHYILLDSW